MILILFGVGVVAQVVVGGGLYDGGLGDHDSITWAWGIGVTMGVYVAGRMSGAHQPSRHAGDGGLPRVWPGARSCPTSRRSSSAPSSRRCSCAGTTTRA